MIKALGKYLGPVPGAVKFAINWRELGRSVITAVLSSGVLVAVLEAVKADLPTILDNPAMIGVMSAGLTLVIDLVRRYGQGAKS